MTEDPDRSVVEEIKEEAKKSEELKEELEKAEEVEKAEEKAAEEEKPKEEKKKKKKEEKKEEKPPYVFAPLPSPELIVETYEIEEPFARVHIAKLPERGGGFAYFADEVVLDVKERRAFERLSEVLSTELEPPESIEVAATQYVLEQAKKLMKKYKSFLGGLPPESVARVEYYVRRDLVGYGVIDVLIRDKNIEDISCDGVGRPIFVWHRKYESIPTNITIVDRDFFNDFVIKLAHFARKHVSSAFPIVDAMLAGKHRLAATYGDEVSPSGATFTIRKFREEPFSIIDLIEMGTMSEKMAAYFWLILENRLTVMIMGGTGAGKTSTLNALANLFKPGLKIVTVEETPELNIPQENWVQFVSRESYGLGSTKIGEVTLFDLVKTSLRYRPDYIIVGEIRGAEAFVLFQAMATGHGGISTIHAESIDYAIKRLTSPPMNVSQVYIPLMNVAMLVERVHLPKQVGGMPFGRRVRYVWELYTDVDEPRLISVWNPTEDSYESTFEESRHLEDAFTKMGKTRDDFRKELELRERIIRMMRVNNIRNFKDVAKSIAYFYARRAEVAKGKPSEETKAIAEAVAEAGVLGAKEPQS